MITTRTWVILSLVLAGLGMIFAINSLLTNQQATEPKVQVLSLAQDIKSGQILQKNMLRWVPDKTPQKTNRLRAKNAQERHKIEKSLNGALLAKDMRQDDVIPANVVIKPNESGFLARVVRSGYRAVSIKIQKSALSDGLISPDDYVDIIATIKATQNRTFSSSAKPSGQDFRTWRSTIIATGVRILALDRYLTADEFKQHEQDSKKRRSKYVTVTFEVTPEQAVKIPLAEQIVDTGGRLTLSLRNPDDALVKRADSRASDLFPGTREEAIKENTVLIRGTKREVSGGL